MKRTRRQFTGEEKVALLRRHLVEQLPVSQVCEEAGIQPTQFYQWQKQIFENGAAAFAAKGTPKANLAEARLAVLDIDME